MIIWLTGLSGSGKSTIALALQKTLPNAIVLDGDDLRRGLCSDLEFSPEARTENVRRASEVAVLLDDAGMTVIVALISPYRIDRQAARDRAARLFVEVFVDAPVHVCEARDPKGLYRKARSGEIADFTGVNAPYETPLDPEVHLRTAERSVLSCVNIVLDHLGTNA